MNLFSRFSNTSVRTQGVIKNIGLSFVAKIISVFCSLLIVPLTIDYIDEVKYGIWLSLSSIITNLTFLKYIFNRFSLNIKYKLKNFQIKFTDISYKRVIIRIRRRQTGWEL